MISSMFVEFANALCRSARLLAKPKLWVRKVGKGLSAAGGILGTALCFRLPCCHQ